MYSNLHIGQFSTCLAISVCYAYQRDLSPPSENFVGTTIEEYAVVAVGSVILPGIVVGTDSLVAAGAIVTKNVEPYAVVGGNPTKPISDTRKLRIISRVNQSILGDIHLSEVCRWRASASKSGMKRIMIKVFSVR